MRPFFKIFIITFLLTLAILAGLEWCINQSVKLTHLLGWTGVAITLTALVGVFKNQNQQH